MYWLEPAIRQYESIIPDVERSSVVKSPKVKAWLTDYLCPVVEDFTGRPAFREYASWSLRALRQSADSPERVLIDKIDGQLVTCGSALWKLLESAGFKKQLEGLWPAPVQVGDMAVTIDADLEKSSNSQSLVADDLEVDIAQIRAIAQRNWKDLVEINDYFEPHQEWTENADHDRVQRGEWVVSANPDLEPIGDFVARCLFKRVEMRSELLRRMIGKCLEAVKQGGSKRQHELEVIAAHWRDLDDSHGVLKAALQTGIEMRLRDACTIITQTYAAFHAAPDLTWLGLEPSIVQNGQVALRARVGSWQSAQFLDRIVGALGELHRFDREMHPNQLAIEKAITSGDLVLVEATNMAYWNREPFEIEFHEMPGRLLLELARKSKHRLAVTEDDVFDDAVSDSTMATTCGRLKSKLPHSLRKCIVSGREPRTYLLVLVGKQAHLF